jgi:hypothetical protein
MGINILVGALSGVSNIPQGLREAQPAPLMLKVGEDTVKVASSLRQKMAEIGSWRIGHLCPIIQNPTD